MTKMPEPSERRALLDRLSRGDFASTDERVAAIELAEAIGFDWPAEDATIIVDGLFRQASILRDTKPIDWYRGLAIALRTIGLLAPFEAAPRLLDFPGVDDDREVKSCALAGLRVMFSAGPAPEPQPALWARLAALLEACLDVRDAASGKISPLSLAVFLVAAASGMPEIERFIDRLPCSPSFFRHQAIMGLREIRAGWTDPNSAVARERLDALILQLPGKK